MLAAARDAAMALDGGPRIEVLAGDITEPQLALGEDRYARLAAETDVVHHLAAIYNLAVPAGGRPARQRRRNRQRPRLLRRRRGPRAAQLRQHRLRRRRRGPASSTSTSCRWARASRTTTSRPSSRPRSGSGACSTGSRPRSSGRRSSSATRGPGETAEVRRPVLRRCASSPRGARGPADARSSAAARRRSTSSRSTSSSPRWSRSARRRRGDRRDVHLVDPEPLSAPRAVRAAHRALRGKRARYRVPPGLVAGALRLAPVRELFGGTPRGIDPLPEQSGRVRHPPRRRAPRRLGAALSALRRVRTGDGLLLPRARGRPGAEARRRVAVTSRRSGGRTDGATALATHGRHQATAIQGRAARRAVRRVPRLLAQPRPGLRLRARPPDHDTDLAEHLPDPPDRGRQRPRLGPGDPRRQSLLQLRSLPRRRLAAPEDPLHGEVADVPPEQDPRPDLQVRRRLPDPPRPCRRGLRSRRSTRSSGGAAA